MLPKIALLIQHFLRQKESGLTCTVVSIYYETEDLVRKNSVQLGYFDTENSIVFLLQYNFRILEKSVL